jgi:hypothetical protein
MVGREMADKLEIILKEGVKAYSTYYPRFAFGTRVNHGKLI